MSRIDGGAERINVFRLDDEYLFAYFFDRSDLFETFQAYYNDDAYRFEVPATEFDVVRERITDTGFDPVVVDDPEEYCVVTEQYAKHADILRDAVIHWKRRGHRFFVLSDERAVEQALERGAVRIDQTDFVLGI